MKFYHFYILSILFMACESVEHSENISLTTNNANMELAYFDPSQLQKLPFDNVEIEDEIISVTTKGGTFHIESGHNLIIPDSAFIYLDGSAVLKDVVIKFESYKSLDEIILSGISMKYDSAGVSNDFKSAGMYKIEGFESGKPVQIAKGKSIEVETYSYQEDSPCYNFYSQDTSGNWQYRESSLAGLNPNFPSEPIPVAPEELKEDDFVFHIAIKGNKYVAKYGNYLWKYDGEREDTINKKEMGVLDHPKNHVRLEKSDRHQLAYDFIIEGPKNYNIPVTPGLFGDNLEEAQAQFQSLMASIELNKTTQQAIADGRYVRSVSIPNFGIYNWDCIHQSNRTPALVSISINRDYDKEYYNVFLVARNANYMVQYRGGLINQFSYDPTVENLVIITLPDNEVAVISPEEFRNAVNLSSSNLEFDIEALDTRINNSEDFKNLMNQI